MKTYRFEPYFSGSPLSKFEYSYNETTMFETMDGVARSAAITPDQFSYLNSLHANEQMAAAHAFSQAKSGRY